MAQEKAKPAIEPLIFLLDDPASRVRFAAAAAPLLSLRPSEKFWMCSLRAWVIKTWSSVVRPRKPRAWLAERPAKSSKSLAVLLKDHDTTVRDAALQALVMLGPAAADSRGDVIPLLDDPRIAIDAADALGAHGSASSSDASSTRANAVLKGTRDSVGRWCERCRKLAATTPSRS